MEAKRVVRSENDTTQKKEKKRLKLILDVGSDSIHLLALC